MTDPVVLIVDDEEDWLARLHFRLYKAGFECKCTMDGEEAINLVRQYPTIRFVLLDQILYVPPVPKDESDRELQKWQGDEVREKILKHRPDRQFIMVTNKPRLDALKAVGRNSFDVAREQERRLKFVSGVLDLFHKIDIQDDPERTFRRLIDLIESQSKDRGSAVQKRACVKIGLELSEQSFSVLLEAAQVRNVQYIQFSEFFDKWRETIEDDKRKPDEKSKKNFLDAFWPKAQQKRVLVKSAASKRWHTANIEDTTQAFEILWFLAKQYETGKDVIIREEDYLNFASYKPRKSRKRVLSELEAGSDPDCVFRSKSPPHSD